MLGKQALYQPSHTPSPPRPNFLLVKKPSCHLQPVTLSHWVPLMRAKSTSTLSPAASWETGRLPVETPG